LGKESSLEGRRMRDIFYRLLLDMFGRRAGIDKQKSSKMENRLISVGE
jgi:hypothetical protein